ncbi:MAG: ParB/RepB/Spo0J family partition protein [Rhodospirillales bacterium]|nr:ParB/RepB/Spo0J family partition protein [Rhodospirillales bacterium]
MSADPKLRGLGRGLSALLGEDASDPVEPATARATTLLPIEQLRPSRFQPRHGIDEDGLQELAASIAEKGVLQPVLVRRVQDKDATFEIIAGERRWRAAQLAQLHEIPVLVRDFSDSEAQEVALIENLQRQDLTALEEAEGYRRLMQDYAHTQEDLARSVGKSRSHVANMLRLLTLPEPVKRLLEDGQLTAGHARAVLGCAAPEAVAHAVVQRGLNVRQTEALAAAERNPEASRRRVPAKDPDTLALERDLGASLGLAVEIRFRGSGGSLVLHYNTLDQLDDILHRLSHGARGRQSRSADR